MTPGVLTIGLDQEGVAVFGAEGGFDITFDAVHTDLVASSMARLTTATSR